MFDGKETDSVNASPILEKGVSVQAGDKIKDYLIFEVMDRNEKLTRKLRSKTRQRLTEAWCVRGHCRHYKTGKTVYVKPYMKGHGKTVPKEYKLS